MTLHNSRCVGCPISTTHHLPRYKTLEHEGIVIWLATRNNVSRQLGVTIENGEVAINTDPKMIYTIFVLDWRIVMDQFIRRSGNIHMTNW